MDRSITTMPKNVTSPFISIEQQNMRPCTGHYCLRLMRLVRERSIIRSDHRSQLSYATAAARLRRRLREVA